jgi:hypothetical protein
MQTSSEKCLGIDKLWVQRLARSVCSKREAYGHSAGRFDDSSVNEWRRHEADFCFLLTCPQDVVGVCVCVCSLNVALTGIITCIPCCT